MSQLLIHDPVPAPPAANPTGPDQGVIEEARRRQRARRIRAVTAATIVIAAAAGVLVAMSGGGTPREAPLHLPAEPPLSSRRLPAGSISVRLSPNLEGGQAGWCVTILEGSGATGTCGPLPTVGHPLLVGGSSWSQGDSDMTTTEVTAPRVAYFLVNGSRRVATKSLPGLPYGLRVAIIHTPLPRSLNRGLAARSPTIVPLDARGEPITESRDYGASWFRDWNPPASPVKGPCELHVSGLEGVTAEWGQVATALRPYPARIVGHGFLSCLDTEYYLARAGRGIRASVLLDAANPGKTAPSPIPGMVPIPGLTGFYNSSIGQGFEPMTAKRQGEVWVVAAGGGRNAEETRVRLLRHLTVTLPL
jgi:hypothetical protein